MKRAFLAALAGVAVVGSAAMAFDPQPDVKAGGQPTAAKPAKEKPKVYDEHADAKVQIAAAVAKAKKENRRVLIQWGGNWCHWCLLLNDLMHKDTALSKELNYEYDVVHIDAGQPAGKNLDLAKSYGADLEKNGFPFLTILDADGKPLANQETSSLEKKEANGESVLGEGMGHDAKKVLAFLKANEAKPLVGQTVLDAGIAEAKSSGKLVFLHFGAPWCHWCHELENWMATPAANELLAKGFVNVKIDNDRMIGGKELYAKYRSKDGGIPWFAFVDGDGKVVATSDNAKGDNIGFPSAKEEIAQFASMLAKATKLSDEDRAKLINTLKNDKPATASAAH